MEKNSESSSKSSTESSPNGSMYSSTEFCPESSDSCYEPTHEDLSKPSDPRQYMKRTYDFKSGESLRLIQEYKTKNTHVFELDDKHLLLYGESFEFVCMKSAWVRSVDIELEDSEWKHVFYSSPEQYSGKGQMVGFISGIKLLCFIFWATNNDCNLARCPIVDLPYEVNPDDVAFITVGGVKIYLFLRMESLLKLIAFNVQTKEMELNTWSLAGEEKPRFVALEDLSKVFVATDKQGMYFDAGVKKWEGPLDGNTELKTYDDGFYLGKGMFFNVDTLKMEKGHVVQTGCIDIGGLRLTFFSK